MSKQTFEAWMHAVNSRLEATVGITADEMGDCPYDQWWQSGMNAIVAARKAVKWQGLNV